MSCRCPIQPDYCVDEPITTLDCAACTTCVLSMNADSLRTVLAHRDRLIERLHATRSTLMAERDSALDQRNDARFLAENLRDGLLTTPRYRSGAGAEPVMDLPWEEGERRTHAAAVRAGLTRQETTMREPSNPGDGPDLGKAARAEHAMTEAHAAELADIVIRCLDYAGRYEIPLGDILAVKMRYYNRTRALRHGGRTL